jgi:hypothetical protein
MAAMMCTEIHKHLKTLQRRENGTKLCIKRLIPFRRIRHGDLVYLPKEKEVFWCKWMIRIKYKSDEKIDE